MLRLVILALSLAVAAHGSAVGGWQAGTVGEVQELALWSTQQLASFPGLEGDYTIQTPRDVQKQVVNGVNYKFTLDVVFRDADNKYTFKSCEMYIFDQPWTNTRQFVEAPRCSQQQNTRMAGGWVQVNAITDEVMDVARISAKQMTSQLGLEGQFNVNRISNVQKQVVNGINYKFTVEYLIQSPDNKYTFQVCDMTVNYKAWLSQVSFVEAPVCQASAQNKAAVAGGWASSAVTADVTALANWCTSQLSGTNAIQGEHTLMTARDVMTQVVAGVNYKFTIDLLTRQEDGKYYFQSCAMGVFVQEWTNTRQITSVSCGPHPNFPNF